MTEVSKEINPFSWQDEMIDMGNIKPGIRLVTERVPGNTRVMFEILAVDEEGGRAFVQQISGKPGDRAPVDLERLQLVGEIETGRGVFRVVRRSPDLKTP